MNIEYSLHYLSNIFELGYIKSTLKRYYFIITIRNLSYIPGISILSEMLLFPFVNINELYCNYY